MTDIYSGLPKKFKACFSPTDLTDTSYLSSDEKVMRDYFFIKKTSDKDFSSLYILWAPVDAGRRSVINTALRSALLIHKKGYRDTLQLILQGERYLSLREFIDDLLRSGWNLR